MNITDRYVSLTANKKGICKNAVINTNSEVIKGIILKIPGSTDGIKNIEFKLEIPQDIIAKVEKTFGKVYKENKEGYIVEINDKISVYSLTNNGLLYGAYAILKHVENGMIGEGIIYNYPQMETRCLKLYIPSRRDIGCFCEYIDYCAFYGYNTVMLEIGGAMEYKKHPEINEGWIEYCEKFSHFPGESLDYQNAPKWARNSIHMENGGGNFLTQEEVKGLKKYIEDRFFEIIPEVPTLSHCDYLLTRHPELRERENDDLPDTYCPSNPKSYELVFDVLDEVIEIFHPKKLNIGHDEFFSVSLCEKCRKIQPYEIYANDIIKIKNYLSERGIETIMWNEMLINAIGKKGQNWGGSFKYVLNMRTGDFLEIRPAIYPAFDLLPNDITMLHWIWALNPDYEKQFIENGNKIIWGNFKGTRISDFKERSKYISGITISNWSIPNWDHLQRNTILLEIAYSAYMLWSNEFVEEDFENNLYKVSADMYAYKISHMKNYVEVINNTDVYKEHMMFVDGYTIDKKSDYLGKYIITFKSGKTMEYPLYYNLNIGTSKASCEKSATGDNDSIVYDQQYTEATYTCRLEKYGNDVYYRTAIEIPENEEVVGIMRIEDSNYSKNINIAGFYGK